jgi:hypothetical protein
MPQDRSIGELFKNSKKKKRTKKDNHLSKLFNFYNNITLLDKFDFKKQKAENLGNRNIKFLPALQTGGIVTEPTEVLAGEAGPEAIIPLDRLQKILSEMSPDDVPVGTTDPVVLANRARMNAGPSETMATVLQEIPLGTSKMSKATINGIVMDRNQDGVITREEAAKARSLKGSVDPLTERVVRAKNIEKTQKMAEARGVSVENLTTGKSDYGNEVPLDLNKDGIITPEERAEAYRQQDELDLGTIKDRGDEVRASRRNLETEKSLYGGMTREQAVLRFGEGTVRDREDIIMNNATGPQGTEDIRQIERITERDRAGDRDRAYVDDSKQQGYEDSSNQLRDQKQELRNMTLEMNRVSEVAGEFTQVPPSDIADARGRFNQGQREIENQMIEDGSLLDPPKTPEPDRVVKAESGERPSYAFGMPKKPPVVEAKSSGEPSPISFRMPEKPPTTEAAPSKEPSPISFRMPEKPPMTEAEPSRVPEKPPMTEDTGIHIDDYVSPRLSSGIAPNPREPLAAPTVSINDYGAGSRNMPSQQRQTVIQPRSVSPTSLAAGNRSERTFMSGGASTSSSFGLLSLMNQKLPNWRTMMG